MKELLITAALLIALSVPAYAESGTGVGSWVDLKQPDESTLANGNTYKMSRSKQIWLSDNLPMLDNVALDCFASWIESKDSEDFFGRGWCTGVDAEGDVVWSDFDMGADGGSWRITGGTGKFGKEKGGGTWAWNVFFPDGLRGTWTQTYDSDWTGE